MRALSLAAISLLAGCSIFDAPDPRHLDGAIQDAGMDAGPDAPSDGGTDGGFDVGFDARDGSMCPATHETHCGDGRDDDCDELVDCADPDCVAVQDPACCVSGVPTVTETFDKDASGWRTISSWVTPASLENAIVPRGAPPGGALEQMGATLTGMVNRTCLQVDLGTQLRFTFQAEACTAGCDGHMDVVLGPSTMFTGTLTDDLAVRGVSDHGALRIDVVQGGTVRASSTAAFGASPVDVTIDLAPGLARGVPAIVASVTASSVMTGALEHIVSQIYVTDRDIFGTSSCHGLHLGVQGVGGGVALDDVSITQLDCSNPARFDAVRDDADSIDAVTVSVADATRMNGWGHGGIGDPALAQGTISGHPTFTLLFDGSNVDRASDVIGHLPLSIGGADTAVSPLALVDDCSRWQPRGGGNPCMQATSHPIVTSPLVMRDPTLSPQFSPGTSTINSFRMAWVGEASAGSDLTLFTGLMDTSPTAVVSAIATPIMNETCTSFRNPLLLPLPPSATSPFLLFYVCDAFPPVVHVATFDPGGPMARRIDGLELGPTALGPLAQQGVIDIAGVFYDYAGGRTYRLWLATRPTTSDTAILYVEGTLVSGSSVPTLTPFAGNPVLTEQSPVFGTCAFGCQLHGITATRIQGDWTHVRLLVERWVDSGLGLQYGLVPLEQTWPTDHPP